MPTNAYLLAQYAAAPDIGILPKMPGILIIKPFLTSTILGSIAFNTSNVLITFT